MEKEIDVKSRFLNRVNPLGESECWPWLGCMTPKGYGQIMIDGKSILAHRLSYMIHNAAITEGFVIDHICGVKSCVNPKHLEAVTSKTNTVRYQNKRKIK